MTSCWQTGAQSLSPCDIRTRTCLSPARGVCASLDRSTRNRITGKQQRAIFCGVKAHPQKSRRQQLQEMFRAFKYSSTHVKHLTVSLKPVPFFFIIQSFCQYFSPAKSANKVWWVGNLLRRYGCENILNPSIATCDSDECRALKTCPCF